MSEREPGHESGEQLHIDGFIIPADAAFPIQHTEVPHNGLGTYQEIVGGHIEAIDLVMPEATFYIDEEGKLKDKPVNLRATAILWVHNPAYRKQDVIVGDAFLVGPVDENGDDTPIPDQLAELLNVPGRFQVEMRFAGHEEWHAVSRVLDDWYEAYSMSFALEDQATDMDAMRVRRLSDA